MSDAIIGEKAFLNGLFPETNWQELQPDGYAVVYKRLNKAGPLGSAAVRYMQQRRTKLGFHGQYKSGAGWTLLNNITLTPGAKLTDPYTLCLISHEVFHLQQSLPMRLSVRGELIAWQFQIRAYRELTGKEIGAAGQAYAGTKPRWARIAKLSPDDRDDLRTAQSTMKEISPDYRSNCLPLFPMTNEMGFYLRQWKLGEAGSTLWNLLTCK